MREAGSPAMAEVQDSAHWLRRLHEAGYDIAPLRMLVRQVALSSNWERSAESREHATSVLFDGLAEWLPPKLTLAEFQNLEAFASTAVAAGAAADRFRCEVVIGDRRVTSRQARWPS